LQHQKVEALEIEFFCKVNQEAINWKKVHMQKLPTGSHSIVGMSRGINAKKFDWEFFLAEHFHFESNGQSSVIDFTLDFNFELVCGSEAVKSN
jgi:hypothetical protein